MPRTDSNSNPSFGRDSHVQQMAPGRHPASARKTKTDKTSKIATWNVRTLHQKGKLENVIKEMERMKFNILGLAGEVYAPTSDSEDVEVEKFYEEIEKAKGYLKSRDTIIVMGDFNAKVGHERLEDVVGPSGIGTVNERGSRLIEWCQVNNFTITNTWYQNHPRRQWTWKSPGDRNRNKIDYILIQKRFRNAVKTSKSLAGANCDSGHIIVMCKFQIILKKLRKANANPKFQMDLLKSDEKLKGKIAVAVFNKYETLKDLNRNIKIKCTAAKEEWINQQCQEIQQKLNIERKFMHVKIKDVSGKKIKRSSPSCIKSKDGAMLMEKKEIINRWSEYVEDLLKDDRCKNSKIKKKRRPNYP
ncbi:craniofacial development protein 2-like protein [Plakobranchus ocellatus]|uniref:Craniofacial development protein 2-like protein n=1 Tax=Plakobranchus ocellatus TaxID=259542 RepID=A0AAV4AI49_9GAST|nr:craniofacial development protein 2-like protein [Plakobranchus ocellatus]